jgi:hypothetical protein
MQKTGDRIQKTEDRIKKKKRTVGNWINMGILRFSSCILSPVFCLLFCEVNHDEWTVG